MQGKPLKMTDSRSLAYALEAITKAQAIDVLIDRARAQLGEDACDDAVMSLIQDWLHPVLIVRGDAQVSLKRRKMSFERSSDEYRHKLRESRDTIPYHQ